MTDEGLLSSGIDIMTALRKRIEVLEAQLAIAAQAPQAAEPEKPDPISDAEQAALYSFTKGTPHYAIVRKLYRAASAAPQAPAQPQAAEQVARAMQWGSLYDAASRLIAAIGYHGERSSRDSEVLWLQECLRVLDDGEHMPGLMPAPQAPAAQPLTWQPIETAPKDSEVWFWLIPKTAEETYCNSSGEPILAHGDGYMKVCKFNCWGSLYKATHWMPLPPDPSGIAPPAQGEQP